MPQWTYSIDLAVFITIAIGFSLQRCDWAVFSPTQPYASDLGAKYPRLVANRSPSNQRPNRHATVHGGGFAIQVFLLWEFESIVENVELRYTGFGLMGGNCIAVS